MRKLLFLLIAGLQMVSFSDAAVGDTADFSSINNSTFFRGRVTAEELRGKVVFIEYWGLQCPPCRAAMPKLQEIYDKYKDRGFVLIASHCQMGTAEQVNSFFNENKLTFPSCSQFRMPQGSPQGGIPFSVLVGSDGKVVAMGSPSAVEAKVDEEMKKMLGGLPILAGLTLKKHQKLQNTIVEGASDIESKIEALRQKSDDEEAQQICKTYDSWLDARKSTIGARRNRDALKFVSEANTLKKSVPSVQDFDDDVAELTAKPEFTKLAEVQKKSKALSKKIQDGKKVSPKALESLINSLEGISSDDSGIIGSAASIKANLSELAETAKSMTGKKTKEKDKKKRNAR